MIDYSEITDGILAVVEEETPILLSLPESPENRISLKTCPIIPNLIWPQT